MGGVISEEHAINRINSSIVNKSIFYFWSVYYCVRLKETGEFIGLISITPYHKLMYKELSYQLLPGFWGNGYAYETIKALIEYYKYKMFCLFSETQSANKKSYLLLEKLGYKLHKKLERFGCEQSIYKINLFKNRNIIKITT